MSDSSKDPESFSRIGAKRKGSVVGDFWAFVKHEKKWWMVPVLAVILGLGLLVVLGGTAAGPFIYTLF